MPGDVHRMLVSDAKGTIRMCASRLVINWSSGCKMKTILGITGEICVCDTDRCNTAAMTSSPGHVIIAVALIASIFSFAARLTI